MKRLLYLAVALFLIVFEAVPEGLALAGHKTVAGVTEFIFLAGVTFTIFAFFYTYAAGFKDRYITVGKLLLLITGYTLLRLAIFDIIHNASAGLPVFYLGDTKLFDIIMARLASFGWFMRFIGGIIGITFLVRK